MALVPHKITALAESDAQGTDGKNIVAGAVVSLYDTNGTAVTLFDNESGANGSTAKQTDATGQIVVFVTAGEYDEEVNGSIKRRVLVGNKEITTEQLIDSVRNYREGDVISTNGFYGAGDGGGSQWKATATTGLTPSQPPADRGAAELVDGSGRLWELIADPEKERKAYNLKSLGAVGDGVNDDTLTLIAGLNSGGVYGSGITLRLTGTVSITGSGRSIFGDIVLSADSSTFNRTDGDYNGANGTILSVTGNKFSMGGRVRVTLNGATNENTTCALVLRSTLFSVKNCQFDGFARTKVVRVESCVKGSVFSYNTIKDCTMGGSTTSQLTGLDVDDNRYGGPSEGLIIEKNVISNLTVTESFESSFGYQTDGINISHPTSKSHIIKGNQISFVGEAIDCFGKECQITGNISEDCFVSGVKLVNGATGCFVFGNYISRPRTYGVLVAGSSNPGTDTSGNMIENNTVNSVNPLSDSPTTSFAYGAEDNTGVSLPTDNTFNNNTARDCGNADRIIFNEATPRSNGFHNTKIIGSTPPIIVTNDPGGKISFYDKAFVKAYPSAQSVPPSGATLDLANIIETREGELSGGLYTAKVPRNVCVSATVRTGASNAGKTWQLDLIKNGSPIEREQVQVSISGDLVVKIFATGLELSEGDTLSFFLSHNEASSTLITSNQLYSVTIYEY